LKAGSQKDFLTQKARPRERLRVTKKEPARGGFKAKREGSASLQRWQSGGQLSIEITLLLKPIRVDSSDGAGVVIELEHRFKFAPARRTIGKYLIAAGRKSTLRGVSGNFAIFESIISARRRSRHRTRPLIVHLHIGIGTQSPISLGTTCFHRALRFTGRRDSSRPVRHSPKIFVADVHLTRAVKCRKPRSGGVHTVGTNPD
jgi:hypothetical protein